ncbi:Nuclear autoantigenic sperm [Brachionus plicatilis]|uniref:Nuclear autoantigenic sperm n=1 Tax=Brachionus plicatilis TaxID=10195 RepID=A0A3M7P2Q5_BRAPC|nr:Nuclear autoantigenic sperm [Brachionus plicatilis]
MQEELSGEQRDERMLAETYYQLGLAQQFSNQLTEANESYKKSINIVQLRIEKLNGKLSQIGEGDDAQLEKNTLNEEIKELEVLLPEMNAKLEELNEQGKETENLIKEAKECFMNSVEEKLGQATTDGEIKDITGLVKSKRKISSSEDSVGIKKTRLSEANEEKAPCEEENKQGEKEMETEINKENVPMAETTEAPVEKIAVDEPVAAAEVPVEEQPVPTA